MRRAYLDHNATTPIDPRVQRLQVDISERFPGNPSSLHREGREARRQLEDARAKIAELLGAEPREVVFTASATEAANTALFGLAARAAGDRRRILASPIEHPCVLEPLERLEGEGFHLDWMRVDAAGRLDTAAAADRLAADVAFTVAMQVNNETGVIQDLDPLRARAEELGIPAVVDLVQVPGKIDLPPAATRAALSFLSAHKFNGPRGLGILLLRDASSPRPLLIGGGQERERRAGTENVAAAVAGALALELALSEGAERRRRREALEERLLRGLDDAKVNYGWNGAAAPRAPGTLNLRFPGHYGETLLMNLDLRGVAVSLGSACSSGSIEASHVLKAMGLRSEENFSSLRVSLGQATTEEEVDLFVTAMAQITAEN